jgi:hypothetical protein
MSARKRWHHYWWEYDVAWPHVLACAFLGHYIIDDQCGRPEHRFCVWCSKCIPEGRS